MKNFFQLYPNAKSYFKVGDQVFLNHCKGEAEMFSKVSGLKLEEVFPTKENEAQENNKENTDQKSDQSKNIKSTSKKKKGGSENKNLS